MARTRSRSRLVPVTWLTTAALGVAAAVSVNLSAVRADQEMISGDAALTRLDHAVLSLFVLSFVVAIAVTARPAMWSDLRSRMSPTSWVLVAATIVAGVIFLPALALTGVILVVNLRRTPVHPQPPALRQPGTAPEACS